MAENDIYNSKQRYETFKSNIDSLTKEVTPFKNKGRYGAKTRRLRYYCKNSLNLKYFKFLYNKFEARDLSYINRIRRLDSMKLVCFVIEKDLAQIDEEDIDKLMRFVNKIYNPKTLELFVTDIQFCWKMLFPEKDEKGRIDETIMPYVVRHLKKRIDKSREKLREDRLTWEEYEKLVNYFNDDPKIQAYITLAFESLGRPQEILFCKIKDITLNENYAKITVSQHGKEGVKNLISIDSLGFLQKWLQNHPFKNDINSYLFTSYNKTNPQDQLKPKIINERLKVALKHLNINKNITCYSLKRNGVTFRLLKGESEKTIQHIAGWKSTKMLQRGYYDLTKQDDIIKLQLIERGLIDDKENEFSKSGIKANMGRKFSFNFERILPNRCIICSRIIPANQNLCLSCKRRLGKGLF